MQSLLVLRKISDFLTDHFFIFYILWVYFRICTMCGLAIKLRFDIEENPGPKANNSCDCLSICHWKLNSICAHNFIKLSLLRTYIFVNKIDTICLSKTYLDYLNSSIPSDYYNLELPGYTLACADNPTNIKRGGVCIYYHNSLPWK